MSIIVTLEHARAASIAGQGVLCAPGIRAWADRHGVDLRQVALEGLPIQQVERIGDAFALRAAAIAREEHAALAVEGET